MFPGEIYLAVNIYTSKEVAVKLESVESPESELESEFQIYQALAGCPGIPRVYWFGRESEYQALVIELLGPSLENSLNLNNRKFSLKRVLLLADQLVCIIKSYLARSDSLKIQQIEAIHGSGYIHRDIKPDHFLCGLGANSTDLKIVDFGLSKMYRDPVTLQHIPFRTNISKHVGTRRYSSLNADAGLELSRRDDLESLFYSLVYLLHGSLPWQCYEGAHCLQLTEAKKTASSGALFTGLPQEFAVCFDYIRTLCFDEEPDYAYLRSLFRNLYNQQPDDLSWEHAYVDKSTYIFPQNPLVVETPKTIRKFKEPPYSDRMYVTRHVFFFVLTIKLVFARTFANNARLHLSILGLVPL